MFSTRGDLNPSVQIKLGWGVILGALGSVMILSDSIDAIKSIIALGALPFVFVHSGAGRLPVEGTQTRKSFTGLIAFH